MTSTKHNETRSKGTMVAEDRAGRRKDGFQNPLVHEGAALDANVPNEELANDKVKILQPNGQPIPTWRGRKT
jgi:hypothetical protein